MKSQVEKDRSIVLTSLFMKFAGIWLTSNSAERLRRNVTFFYVVSALIFATYVLITDLFHCWGDFSAIAYLMCNIMTLLVVLMKMFILTLKRSQFLNLIVYTRDKFWNGNYNSNEMKIIEECSRKCMFFVYTFTFLSEGTVCGYVVSPLIENIKRNESERVLPITMWFNLPLSMTPCYEVMFVIQVLTLWQVGICYCCFDNLFCVVNVHAAAQFRILQSRLIVLNNSEERPLDYISNERANCHKFDALRKSYAKLKDCIQQHQALIRYCEEVNSIFTIMVLGQMLLFSVQICLTVYQVLLANAPTHKRVTFVLYILGSLSHLFMYTYTCHQLTEESDNVADAVYSSSWRSMSQSKVGRTLCKNLLVVSLRARKACYISAGGFFPISLETYTAVISTAASYFTLMKQRSISIMETQ